MRKLIIDEQHKEMVNNFIKDGEKGARTRILGSYDNLVALVEGYKKKLPFIHKNSLQDCRLTIRIGAGDFPNCYKCIPFGTYVSGKFRADGPLFLSNTIINESGMYSLIFGSKLESAKHFKHWVTSEVLPSIRKTGGYSVKESNDSTSNTVDEKLDEIVKQIRSIKAYLVTRDTAQVLVSREMMK